MAMATDAQRYLLTVEQFEQMIDAGIIGEDDRVELDDGELVKMAAMNARHAECVNRLNRFLCRALPDDLVVSPQNPIRLNDRSRPEPDIAVYPLKDYGGLVPPAAAVLLVIEVADTTRDNDRGRKLPRYAQANIAEAWLVDLVTGLVEQHTDPVAGTYRHVLPVRPGQTITATTLPMLTIPVAYILG